jgi:hypothetical protein
LSNQEGSLNLQLEIEKKRKEKKRKEKKRKEKKKKNSAVFQASSQ